MQYRGKVVRRSGTGAFTRELPAICLVAGDLVLRLHRSDNNESLNVENLVGKEIIANGHSYQGDLFVTAHAVIG